MRALAGLGGQGAIIAAQEALRQPPVPTQERMDGERAAATELEKYQVREAELEQLQPQVQGLERVRIDRELQQTKAKIALLTTREGAGGAEEAWQVIAEDPAGDKQLATTPSRTEAAAWVETNKAALVNKSVRISRIGTETPTGGVEKFELITDPKEREKVGAGSGDTLQKSTQTGRYYVDRAPRSEERQPPQGYKWTDDKHAKLEPIPGGPAEKKGAPQTVSYTMENQNVTEFYNAQGERTRSVYSPRWAPGTLARVEEFPIDDNKLRVVVHGEDGKETERFTVSRFAGSKETSGDLELELLKKFRKGDQLTQDEMDLIRYFSLKGNPVGPLLANQLGIEGLHRPRDEGLLGKEGGLGTKESPYLPISPDVIPMLPKGSFFVHPETKKLALKE